MDWQEARKFDCWLVRTIFIFCLFLKCDAERSSSNKAQRESTEEEEEDYPRGFLKSELSVPP